MSLGPSPHLTWKELACKDGTPYPAVWRPSRAVTLAAEFEAVRALVGRPVRIGSAYRTPAHNKAIGGAARSQHVEGRALDLYPPTGVSVQQLYDLVRARAREEASAIYGIGKYPTFVHMDVRPPRPDGKLTVWAGVRAWAEVKTESHTHGNGNGT